MLAATGRTNELRIHIKGTLANGATAEEIRDVLLLVAIYCGRTGADADAGLRWIEDLGTKNRYVLDVWAGG